jgi:DNA repair protein radc
MEGRRERIREKIRAVGLDALAPHEILETMLYPFVPRKDTSPLARALLNEFSGLEGVLNAREEELLKVPGMPAAAAFHFPLFIKIISRAKAESVVKKKELSTIKDAQDFLSESMALLPTEELRLLCLDIKRRIIKMKTIGTGDAATSDFTLRNVADAALSTSAVYAILAHNHPSGDPRPSKNDLLCTVRAYSLLKDLNVELIDHIIVGKGETYSMRMKGELEKLKEEL